MMMMIILQITSMMNGNSLIIKVELCSSRFYLLPRNCSFSSGNEYKAVVLLWSVILTWEKTANQPNIWFTYQCSVYISQIYWIFPRKGNRVLLGKWNSSLGKNRWIYIGIYVWRVHFKWGMVASKLSNYVKVSSLLYDLGRLAAYLSRLYIMHDLSIFNSYFYQVKWLHLRFHIGSWVMY